MLHIETDGNLVDDEVDGNLGDDEIDGNLGDDEVDGNIGDDEVDGNLGDDEPDGMGEDRRAGSLHHMIQSEGDVKFKQSTPPLSFETVDTKVCKSMFTRCIIIL